MAENRRLGSTMALCKCPRPHITDGSPLAPCSCLSGEGMRTHCTPEHAAAQPSLAAPALTRGRSFAEPSEHPYRVTTWLSALPRATMSPDDESSYCLFCYGIILPVCEGRVT
jgi:hypothetical protein